MSDLHTNGTANRAPAGVQDDIVNRLLDCGCIVFGGVYVAESRHDCLRHRAADLIEAQQAEIERLTQHSVILNRVSWQLHDALGMIPEGADSYRGDIEATLPTICQIIKEARRG